ncbi:MAG: phosphoglucosamine mutase [Thermoanaerobaculia bacterium]
MSRGLFGTDGIRARFGDEPLTESTVRRLGAALGAELVSRGNLAGCADDGHGPLVLLGGDTRASSPALVRWMTAGLAAAGARAIDLGVVPTAAVAWAVPRRGAQAGVVASASHNPASDNGLKFIDGAGFKWTTTAETQLESRLAGTPASTESTASAASTESTSVTGSTLANASPDIETGARYLRWLIGEAGGRHSLDGLRIALDAANGAAAAFAGELFLALGAEVELLYSAPDGTNINQDCGSTHPRALAARMASGAFDVGFAFDGDADRALLLDEHGCLHDGDAMLYLWARDLHQRGELAVPKIVATSMSNLGLESALAAIGVEVVRCDVGDRSVVAALRSAGLRLGGEQSGHLVDLHCSTTGDGLLTAVRIATIAGRAVRAGSSVTRTLAEFRRFPQVLLNVPVARKPELGGMPAVAAAARAVEGRLGESGRLVLRYSGTEPLARIMIEGPDESSIAALAEELAQVLRREIGGES